MFSLRLVTLFFFLFLFPLSVSAAPPITNKTLSDQMLIFQQQMEDRFEELSAKLLQKKGTATTGEIHLQDIQQLQGKLDELGFALANLQLKVEALGSSSMNQANGTSGNSAAPSGALSSTMTKELRDIKTAVQDLGYKVYLVESSLTKKITALQDDLNKKGVVASSTPVTSPKTAVNEARKAAIPTATKTEGAATEAPAIKPVSTEVKREETASVETKPAPSFGGMEESYKAAYNDFLRQNYDLAVMGFQSFLENFPNTSLSDNAKYWIGESYYSEGKYEEARKSFNALLENFPDSNKRGEAIFKIARCYDKLQNFDAATRAYQQVISEYPGTSIAERSSEYLSALGNPPQE